MNSDCRWYFTPELTLTGKYAIKYAGLKHVRTEMTRNALHQHHVQQLLNETSLCFLFPSSIPSPHCIQYNLPCNTLHNLHLGRNTSHGGCISVEARTGHCRSSPITVRTVQSSLSQARMQRWIPIFGTVLGLPFSVAFHDSRLLGMLQDRGHRDAAYYRVEIWGPFSFLYSPPLHFLYTRLDTR